VKYLYPISNYIELIQLELNYYFLLSSTSLSIASHLE